MDVKYSNTISRKIRLYLVFFCLTSLASCGLVDRVDIEKIDYEDEKAVGVTFTTNMDVEDIRFFVGEESQTSVIGVIVGSKEGYNFAPVVPFTAGQTYTVRKKNTEVLASFAIPNREGENSAKMIGIHPQKDTVPENLLKMYFEFEQPMQEIHNALDFITVYNETDAVETAPFLRLESQLWNKEGTLLTLWLDPGRIKTDLIPNREKGLPLTKGKSYTVSVDSSWKAIDGRTLQKKYTKRFYVGSRDDKKPNTDTWQVQMHDKDSVKNLIIDFNEPMDAFLAKETIQIYDSKNTPITGNFSLLEKGTKLRFEPNIPWPNSAIEIHIESRLEDLAGNNLNRLFDSPITEENVSANDSLEVHTIKFAPTN